MFSESLAPINWQMGQTLLPEHLHAQEHSLSLQGALRQQSFGLPAYGISAIEWDDFLLSQGSFKLTGLRLFTRGTSYLVDYPANCEVVSDDIIFSENQPAPVYFFVLDDKQYTNFQRSSSNKQVHSLAALKGSEVVERKLYKLVLSPLPTLPEECVKDLSGYMVVDKGQLALFNCNAEGHWRLASRFIPPLMQIQKTVFLQQPLTQLMVLLNRSLKYSQRLLDGALPDGRRHEIKHNMLAISEALQFIGNIFGDRKIAGQLACHPYFLYEQLLKLDRQLSLANDDFESLAPLNYQHDDLYSFLKALFHRIIPKLNCHQQTQRSFELLLKDGCYRARLPEHIKHNDDLYLIISHHSAKPLEESAIPRLASFDRLRCLSQYALNGVTIKAIQHSQLVHFYGNHTQCFKLLPGDERQYICKERSVAFLAQPEFSDYRFFFLHQPNDPIEPVARTRQGRSISKNREVDFESIA